MYVVDEPQLFKKQKESKMKTNWVIAVKNESGYIGGTSAFYKWKQELADSNEYIAEAFKVNFGDNEELAKQVAEDLTKKTEYQFHAYNQIEIKI